MLVRVSIGVPWVQELGEKQLKAVPSRYVHSEFLSTKQFHAVVTVSGTGVLLCESETTTRS
ncbi:hypothetical protein DCAR_0521239 [Daucus carota subsp. sativus]|uniref:Uncharacterized protein n=1 Tax=Daucus carota subsp. sativus TaxID=79200 RepID=A0A161YND4_DAUCS|nr:hypothetical protein DCAR_0521239 [Daucus carota subsp. sativus]